MIMRLVQVYGQVRLGKLLAAPLGFLVTLSITQSSGDTPAILIAPYHTGDEDEPDYSIVKLCDSNLTVPAKLRQAVGIKKYVELLPQGKGQVLIIPCSDKK